MDPADAASGHQPPQLLCPSAVRCQSCRLWLADEGQWDTRAAGEKHRQRAQASGPAQHSRAQLFQAQQ
eukprot:9002511-Lingulodinium_polyedra.AAC.1